MEPARQLCLLQVGRDVLVGHLLEAGLEEVDFLRIGLVHTAHITQFRAPAPLLPMALLARARQGRIPRTSSSLQALPPPVEAVLRFLVMPYSWRSMTSEVGVYADGAAICIVGDILKRGISRRAGTLLG